MTNVGGGELESKHATAGGETDENTLLPPQADDFNWQRDEKCLIERKIISVVIHNFMAVLI